MYGMNGKTLTLVRELGFNNTIGKVSTETVFFLGPCMKGGCREDGANATEEAILEFIVHCEHQVQVAKDYLSNRGNNKTHEWTVEEVRCITCGSRDPLNWPVVQYGGKDYPCPNKSFHDPNSLR